MKLLFSELDNAINLKVQNLKSNLTLLSPYIKLNAFKKIIEDIPSNVSLSVVCRLSPRDIKFGASDFEFYKFALEKGIYVYINNKVHLKTYLYDFQTLHTGSANCTNNGLAGEGKGNYETLIFSENVDDDYLSYLERIKTKSDILTFEKLKEIEPIIEKLKSELLDEESEHRFEEEIMSKIKKEGEIFASQLPYVSNIETIYNFLTTGEDGGEKEKLVHDVGLFKIELEEGETLEQLKVKLRKSFFEIPFTSGLWASFEESINFGGVRRMLEKECVDDPRPTREDVNVLINNFFNWIEELQGDDYEVRQPNHTKIIFKK